MKRAIVGLICSVLAVLIFSQQTFAVGVVVANPSPSTVYVAPDPYWQTGQALGNLLGALIQSSNERAAQKKYDETVQQIQNNIDNTTINETATMVKIIYNAGLDALWNELDSFIYSEGATPYKNISDGIATMTYTKDLGSGNQMFREYSINMNTQQCRCIVKILPIELNSVYIRPYTLPPQTVVNSPTNSVGSYLGVLTSTEKTKEGGFTILEVTPGGLSEFAGVQKGDVLTKIDTYDLKEHDIERVASYIDMRIKQKAIIKATVLRDNKTRVIAIQL